MAQMCLIPEVREAFRKELKNPDNIAMLEHIPDCKQKRTKSEYQLFVSECLKEVKVHGKDAIIECASRWRKQKNGNKTS